MEPTREERAGGAILGLGQGTKKPWFGYHLCMIGGSRIHLQSGGFPVPIPSGYDSVRTGAHLFQHMTVPTVRENPLDTEVPALGLEAWTERWPWLIQGITTSGEEDFDLALFGGDASRSVTARWEALISELAVTSAVHSRQVHEATVRVHGARGTGLRIGPAGDGHVTRDPGLLLTASVADCVPVYLVAPEERVVAVVHAGWRGAAQGILERAIRLFQDRFGIGADRLHAHAGPSICGSCYEVGPEVHEALGEPAVDQPTPVDLRGNLLRRAARAGIAEERLSRSGHCTRCGTAGLFSHRGGDTGRQMAFIGVRSRP